MKMPLFSHDWEKLSDYELGVRLLSHWITIQAVDLGIKQGNRPEGFVEQVRQNILTKETDDVRRMPLQIALHKAASGDFEKAGKTLRKHYKNIKKINEAFDEVRTGSRRQQKYAKEKRPNKFKELIEKIVKKKPQITEPELRRELYKYIGLGNIIYSIDEDDSGKIEITFFGKNENLKTIKTKSLKDRLSKAKKELAK